MRVIWPVVCIACAGILALPSCGGRRSEQFRQQGDTMLELGKLDEAETLFAQSLEADAQNAGAIVGLGRVLEARGDQASALGKYREAMAVDATNVAAYESAIASLVESGDTQEALDLVQRLEGIDKEKADALAASINSAATLSADAAAVEETPRATPLAPRPEASTSGRDVTWEVLWREGALGELLHRRHEFGNDDPRLQRALVMAAVFQHDADLARDLAGSLPADAKERAYLDVMGQNDVNALLEFMQAWEVDPEDAFEASLHNNALAYALARVGGRARAIQVLSQTAERYPDYRMTMANVAWIYRMAGMTEQETRVLQRWVLDAPENMDARTLLFERFRRSGQHDDARQAAEVAFSLYPSNVRSNLNLAQAYLDAGEHDVALATLDNAVKQNPNDPRLFVARGEVLLHSGQPDQALGALESVNIDQSDSDVRYRATLVRAFAHAAAGQWSAVLDLRPAITEARPEATLSSQFLLAAALLHDGQPQAAVDLLSVRDPSREVANPLTALVLAGLGQQQQLAVGDELVGAFREDGALLADFTYALALKAAGFHGESYEVLESVESRAPRSRLLVDLLQRALLQGLTIADRMEKAEAIAERYADMSVSWIGLALLADSLGNDAAERAALDRAAEVGASDTTVWMQRGQYFSRRNMIPEAMEAYRRQLALNPEDPMANNNLAYYLTLTGENMDEALERAQKAKDALGPNPNVLHTLGVAQLRTGKLEESQENLAVALELRPGEPTLLLDFGKLLIERGREEEGKRQIEMALRYSDVLGLDFPRRDEALAALGLEPPSDTN